MTASPVSQFRTFVNKYSSWTTLPPNSKKEKVWEAVKFAFKCLLAVCLLALNPTLFIAGLIIGAASPKKVSKIFENLFTIKKQWPLYSALFIGATACVALPVLSGTSSLLFAAYLSSKLINESKKNTNTVIPVTPNGTDHIEDQVTRLDDSAATVNLTQLNVATTS